MAFENLHGREILAEALDEQIKKLVKACAEARELAYCPYSKFAVGAALLGEDGKVYTGCNVENASFGATICAERTAAVKAISQGVQKFSHVAVIASNTRQFTPPCGICRQFLAEFGDNMTVICVKTDLSSVRQYYLSELLPESFVSF